MQLNTIMRLGSLAFDVAQDDNVRELIGMVHKGGKRRGLWATPQSGQSSQSNSEQQQAAAKSETKAKGKPAAKEKGKKEATPPIPFGPSWTQMPTWMTAPEAKGSPVPPTVGKYFTSSNAKKALKMAGNLGQFLMK